MGYWRHSVTLPIERLTELRRELWEMREAVSFRVPRGPGLTYLIEAVERLGLLIAVLNGDDDTECGLIKSKGK